MAQIKNIKEVTEPLKEQILKGDVHTIEEMRAWLKPLDYSDTINEAAISLPRACRRKIVVRSMVRRAHHRWPMIILEKNNNEIYRV